MGDSYGNQQEVIELRKAAEAKVNKMSEEEKQLRRHIREKIKSDTLTFYDTSILYNLCKAPWGPFELHEETNKPKLISI